jgi:NAD(P)-dependent dehydrogenase (short-subunit alcohol dehydrogenase family)
MLISDLYDLTGKVICVTGASSGLGRHIATVLSLNGAKVVGVARNKSNLEDWVSKTGLGSDFVVSDLADRKCLTETIQKVEEIYGPPDILVNAAGINTREHADEVSHENWDKTLEINLSAPFFLAQGFAPAMVSKGWGRIVNFASLQCRKAFPAGISYGASKGGVEQLTRAMAEAWSGKGVTVNALAPGFFPTELTKNLFKNPDLAKKIAKKTCIGRNGQLTDIEGPIFFLCSQASDYVTGQTLFVDGGFTVK